jgi:Tfp pilus assembly protein PilE
MRSVRPSAASRQRVPRGLIVELVLTVVIVATAWSFAKAAYASHVRSSARSEVRSLVTTAAERQARFFAERKRYADSLTVLDIALPASLEDKFAVVVEAVDGPSPAYSIKVTAKGDQANDKCPTLLLDRSGQRSPAHCW